MRVLTRLPIFSHPREPLCPSRCHRLHQQYRQHHRDRRHPGGESPRRWHRSPKTDAQVRQRGADGNWRRWVKTGKYEQLLVFFKVKFSDCVAFSLGECIIFSVLVDVKNILIMMREEELKARMFCYFGFMWGFYCVFVAFVFQCFRFNFSCKSKTKKVHW